VQNRLVKQLNLCVGKNIPFVSYRLPHETSIHTRLQLSGKINYVEYPNEVFDKEGFIYAPFHRRTDFPVIFFEPETIIENDKFDNILLEKIKSLPPLYPDYEIKPPEQVTKEEYFKMAEKFVDRFNDDFKKAVLSRVKIVSKPKDFDPAGYFLQLTKNYPNAFCHLIHIPGAGTWTGATPETLLRSDIQTTKTVALAGTLSSKGKKTWKEKETNEQQIVTDYIEKLLIEFGIKNYKKEKTTTVRAGNALHLSTGFTFATKEIKDRLPDFIEKLHPTPAVCGLPKEKALDLILDTEKHNREYYSGFLGTVNVNGKTDLFVNLRCMKILKKELALFAGGGLTKQSQPEKEWEETELKAKTLLSCL